MPTRNKPASTPPILHRGIGMPTKCRSTNCGAEIVFAETTGGKMSPFQKDDHGQYVLENGLARFVGSPTAQLELGAPAPVQRWTSHFATCTDSASWRGSGT